MIRIPLALVCFLGFSVVAEAQPTACDLLAAHPADPDKITEGVSTSVVSKDLDTAIAVCRSDLARDPENPRLAYYLGRVLFYKQALAEGRKYIEAAAAKGHRQAQFVAGLITNRDPDDGICRAGGLWLGSARGGHYGATVSLVQKYLAGEYADCAMTLDVAELKGLLDNVRDHEYAQDYYNRVLIAALDAGFAARE